MTTSAAGQSPRRAAAAEPFGLLRQPREVLFGTGQRAAVPSIVASLGKRVSIVTDERMTQDAFYHELREGLVAAGVTDVSVFDRTEPDLPLRTIDAAVGRIRAQRPDVLIGLGGGSCMDLAKVVAVLLTHGGSTRDYYGEFAVPGPTLPVVAIPTTAGTGSEVTPVAVLSDPDLTMKVGISSPHLIPYAAVVDPALTHSCPPGLTASVGADALAHVVESFTAIRHPATPGLSRERVFVGKGELTDQYALHGIELIGRSLRAAVDGGPGADTARSEMMMAALCGGFALGTAGTAAAHAFQYPVGAMTHTPHGVGVGVLLPYVMAFNGSRRPQEMARIAELLGVDAGANPTAAAVRAVADLLAAVKIPATLKDLGVRRDDLDTVAEQGLRAKRLVENNPVHLGPEEARELVENAFTGRLL
ncbi:iron-containing alcohol dehydrogenase [Streptomyces yatensis]|uniref:Iron-containing alcohol dehydrogenase n=1 Tax=Streptomyces yatensis TaxID=155177 RepID=A0ABN2I3H1_9ACTN|nr:iron-containing alcohol dehydrogenase [Streptomyces yatensis]